MRAPESHFGKLLRFCVMSSVALVLLCNAQSLAQVSPTTVPGTRSSNPYNEEFAARRLEFESSSPARQAVITARTYRLRDFVDRAADVSEWLNSVASNSRLHPLVRSEATRYLAAIDVHTGRFNEAKARLNSLGLVRDWAVLNQSQRDQADADKAWERLSDPGSQLWLDVRDSVPQSRQAYIATSIYSETERSVALRYGAEGEGSLSLNGVEVFTSKRTTKAAFDQYAVGAQLRRGWNSIVLKLRRTDSDVLSFALRITTPDGDGIQLKASPGVEHSNDSAVALDTHPAAISDLVDMATADSSADPRSAAKLQTLGMIEIEHSREGALENLEAAARIQPSAKSWLEIAQACAGEACTFRALSAALRDNPNNERATVAFADYYLGRNQVEKARALLQKATQQAPGDFVAGQRLIDLYVSAGLNNLALQQTRELQERFPGPLWLRSRIAETYQGLGLLKESQRVLESVLPEQVDDSRARNLMNEVLRQARETERLVPGSYKTSPDSPEPARNQAKPLLSHEKSADLEAQYLEDAENLAASTHRNPPSTGDANVAALSDVRVERVAANGLSAVRMQQVLYVATEQGARQYSSQTVQYAPGSQSLRINRARVYKKDGTVIEGREGDDSRVADASISMYYDARSREVQFPGVEKGDVIELDYTITPTQPTNPYGDYFGNLVVFRTSIPEQLKRYVLISPSSMKLKVVETRMPDGAEISEKDGTRTYRWEARGLSPLPNETRGPAVTEIAPYVHVSTFASWTELGRWYAGMIGPQFTTDQQLRELAARLVQGKRSELDKVNAIYDFVLRNTHYVAFEFGIYSYKPYPVTEIYRRRFGDCKDKASLMITLLREAGIEADFALLRTRRMGEIDLEAASIALFNHAIVYLPNWNMWLDGTADYYGSGEIPVEDQGAMALVVAADGRSSLLHVPITQPEDNYTRRTVRAVLANDGSMQFHGESYTRGEDAPGLRREYESPDRQRNSVRDSLAKVFPSVRVDDVRVHDESAPQRSVNVEFRGEVDNFIGQHTASLPTSWTHQGYLQRLAPLPSRSQNLILPAPWMRDEELRFQLPSGAEVVSLPANTQLSTKFGNLHVRYEKHNREIVIKTSLKFSAILVAPGDYSAFRTFCRSVEQAYRGEVKVAFRR